MSMKTLRMHQLEGSVSGGCLTENKNWEIADVIRVALLLCVTHRKKGVSHFLINTFQLLKEKKFLLTLQ